MNEVITEAVEVCPYCEVENVFPNWDVEKQGYIAKCWNCGKEIFLCDECLHSDDNPKRICNWNGIYENGKEKCSVCFRGVANEREYKRIMESRRRWRA